jgi:hypothetical protein
VVTNAATEIPASVQGRQARSALLSRHRMRGDTMFHGQGWRFGCIILLALVGGEAALAAGSSRQEALLALSRELGTCSGYYLLLSNVIENALGPAELKANTERLKSISLQMLARAGDIASTVGESEDATIGWAQDALKEMVDVINSDPQGSLATMHTRYGLPCDRLADDAEDRLAKLLRQYHGD